MSNTFPIEELRSLLEKARATDADLKQFGAEHHKYQWNSPASLKEIEAFERETAISLPDGYRNFLLQAGNGGAGPFYGLFSLEQVKGWLSWQVESGETPYLAPGTDPDSLKDLGDRDHDWRRGCIPIESQGDTYFTYLLVAGPDRGRVVYIEYERSWIFFPREPDFLSWYIRWLREAAAGYDMGWFGLSLDGDEETLRKLYIQADTDAERLLAVGSMDKFPVLSEASRDFIRGILDDWIAKENVDSLPLLAYRVDPVLYGQFLDKRWKAGLFDQVVYELYHTPAERKDLAKSWRERILDKLSELSPETYCIVIPLLRMGGEVKLEQVAFLLDKAEGREKRELLYDLGRFPDAKEHLEIWLDFLREREDLELLHYALISVPRVNESRLREALLEVQEAFPFALEHIHVDDYKDKEAMERSFRRDAERKVYKGAGTVLKDLFYESINPEDIRFPRPYRLEMPGNALADLGMYRTIPADGILLHPLIALAIRQESDGRLPSTAWDWGRKLKQMKKLQLVLSEKTVQSWDDERRYAYLRAPEEHFPPEPYYYDLRGWSAIGRMENLRELRICEICVEDFSFLTECKNLRTLSLYNTNFTDCRLLLKLPKLKYIDLRSCRLIHKEVLKKLHVECEL